MNDSVTNLLSALAVSVIISSMARVRGQKLKAILYTLPFPITIALIGSESIATSLSLTGLALTAGFLWGCYFLHSRLRVPILVTDGLLSILYVLVAYILASNLEISFWSMLALYVTGWIGLMFLFRKTTFRYKPQLPTKANPLLKALMIFGIAFGLFSAHQYLAAFVVTFPYNGVFAVYENKTALLAQAALFTRNSIALASFFVANYLVGTQQPAPVRYLASWSAFGLVLIAANHFIEVRIKAD